MPESRDTCGEAECPEFVQPPEGSFGRWTGLLPSNNERAFKEREDRAKFLRSTQWKDKRHRSQIVAREIMIWYKEKKWCNWLSSERGFLERLRNLFLKIFKTYLDKALSNLTSKFSPSFMTSGSSFQTTLCGDLWYSVSCSSKTTLLHEAVLQACSSTRIGHQRHSNQNLEARCHNYTTKKSQGCHTLAS